MNRPTAAALILRFGAREMAERAVPDNRAPIAPELLEAAAQGQPLNEWSVEETDTARQALQRIEDAITRAQAEAAFYLRFRPVEDTPDWLADDLPEMARYHLCEDNGAKDSTVRLRYLDVIRRLETLAEEDAARGVSEAGYSGLSVSSNPRLFTRRQTRRL